MVLPSPRLVARMPVGPSLVLVVDGFKINKVDLDRTQASASDGEILCVPSEQPESGMLGLLVTNTC